ncbi:MAG: hypothetical protein QF809_03930 [Candidatus Peribacteraceae bacterium]|jgi:hypothetical protein|nr:hypothetical protein [Candidatus Peribacteraceae bacterium]MDP7646299.1 hypothetical protein [Candidatus Peribacteraceae bacterium]
MADIIDAEIVDPRSIWEILDSPDFQETYIIDAPEEWIGKEMKDASGTMQTIQKDDRIIRNPAHPDVFMKFSDEAALKFVTNGLVWDKDSEAQVADGIDLDDPHADRSISQMIEQDERPLLNRLFHDPLSLFRGRRPPIQSVQEVQRRTYAQQMSEGRTIVGDYPDAQRGGETWRDRIEDLNMKYILELTKREKDMDGVWCKKSEWIIHNGTSPNPKRFLRDTPENRARFIKNGRKLGGL